MKRGTAAAGTAWRERPEGGSALIVRLGCRFALAAGRRITRIVLPVASLYYFLRRKPERRASQQYLARVTGRSPSHRDVFRHINLFGAATLDRVYLLSNRFAGFRISCHGLAELDATLARGEGVLLFGSHLGSFEALRVLALQRPEVSIRALIDTELNPTLSAEFSAMNPMLATTVINTRQAGPAVALAVNEALEQNAIVALLADRALPGNATVRAQFLGASAAFPSAPWLLAAACKAPVMLAFGLYRGGNRYDLHFEPFADRVIVDRRDRATALAALVQRFADRLAHYAKLAPYNWFNFYDFWDDDAAPRAHLGGGAVSLGRAGDSGGR